MQCPKCSAEIPEKSKFCGNCGAAIVLTGDPAVQRAAASADPAVPEEHFLWQVYPSLRTAVPPLLGLLVLLAVVVGALYYFLRGNSSTGAATVRFSTLIIAVLVLAGVMIRSIVRLRSVSYKLSTQRIFVTRGLFNTRTDEVELEHYRDVYVNQHFWDKLMGCGDIEVVTGDVIIPTVNIIDVVDPIGKKETIRDAARERKIALGIIRREEL